MNFRTWVATAVLLVSAALPSRAADNAYSVKVVEKTEPPKELVVKSVRGSLQISVEDDVREIPEGEAYRIVLDPNADPQGPRGAGTKGMGGPPIKAAKSRFIWYAVAITAGVTIYVAHEAWESAYKP